MRHVTRALACLAILACTPWVQAAETALTVTAAPAVDDRTVQAEGLVGKSGRLVHFTDSDGKTRKGELKLAPANFPLRVFEETPTGMVRLQIDKVDYWVAGEDLRIKRPTQAACLFAAKKVITAADRGANEGCAPVKK